MSAAASEPAHTATSAASPPPSTSITAARNALKLGSSLLLTWSVALAVRFVLPRYLGPEVFGTFTFSDTLAATYFVLLGFGLDLYIQKEISVRPAHASDFFGGVLLVRALFSVPLLAGLAVSLLWSDAPEGAHPLVFVFGLAQLVVSVNNSLAALLQAHGTVGRLAVINVASKVLWGAGIALAVVTRAPLVALALSFLVSEATRAVLLWPIVRRELDLQLRVDLKSTRAVLRACSPFFVNAVAVAMCSKMDVTMLGFITGDQRELGWYGASSNLAGLALMLAPLVHWIVMPMLSRAKAESHERFVQTVRSAVANVITATLPIMLLIALGADFLVRLLFGEAFAPAALSLRMLGPLFVFTYLAILLSMSLITLGRAWTLTSISLVGAVLNPLLAVFLVPLCARTFGPGGAGLGTASSVVLMQVAVTSMLTWSVGREVLDLRTLVQVARSLLAAGAVILLHFLLAPLGPARLLLDAAAYLLFAWLFGAIHPAELLAFARRVAGRRGAPQAPAS